MPSSLVIAAYFGAGAAGLTAATAALGTFGLLAARFAINFAVSMIVTRAFTSGNANQNVDNGVRQQVPPATTNSIPIVYGDAYLGGVFIDAVLSTDQKTMYYVLAISQISPNGQFTFDTTKMYWQDQTITFDGADPTKVVSLTDGAGNIQTKISGNLFINLYKSNEAGTITALNGSALPNSVMGGSDIAVGQRWPSSGRQMNGLAFAIIKMVYNRDAGTTQMQPITFRASHYLNSTGVAKPGDVWYDYITNDKYGCAMDASIVDNIKAIELNSYSDQTITYTPAAGGSATQARYRINGVMDTGQDVLSNLDQIMLACDSWNQYNAATGKWSIVINKAETESFAFNDSNIIGEIRVSAFDIASSINQIQAQFPSKLNRDQSDYVYLNTPAGLLFANEPDNKYTITLGLVNDSVQAQYLANRMLEQAREDLIVTFSTTYNGIQVDAGDVISVTNSAYGWNGKLFRVIKVSEASLPDGNLGAAFELNEYNAQVYDDASITAFSPTPNSNLSNPNFFSNLTAPTVANINTTATIPHFDVVCGIPATGRVTEVTLFYTTVSSPTTSDWAVWGVETLPNSQPFAPSTSLTFADLNLPTATYYFAFKVANEIGGSALSATSTGFTWSPNPTTTAVAGTFLATFSPIVMQVPRNSSLVPSFTGLITQLYGSAAGGAIDFVTAQADSDASFVDNTWRIGASSTTGNADVSTSGGLVMGSITDGGTFAQWGIPTAMSSSPATLTVPVRYKSSLGVVSQGATAILQFVFVDQGATGSAGADGNQAANPTLYQWATTTPSNPSGTSTYTWATGVNASYSGGGGWTTTIPANPNTAGIQLWTAIKPTVVAAGTTTSTISWTSGFTISSVTANGANGANGTNGTNGTNGLQTARPVVYLWAATLPSSPTGTTTYTWSTSSYAAPSGWSTSITSSPSAGFTLWAATVNISDTATATTTTINWGLSSIIASGYAGTNGATGATGPTGPTGGTGSTGNQGASARICYTKTTLSSLDTTPTTITTSGSASFPSNNSWGAGTVWVAQPPTITAGESVYQSDGIYDPVTGNTVWNVPYLSALKVGSLSAITANTGNLTVSGTIQSNTGAISGTTMTGSGAVIYSSGNFAVGNSTNNITYDGSAITLNGTVVFPSNINSNNLTLKDGSGNVILGNGTPLNFANITPASGWLNTNITISAGAISGIGTGNGTAVANSSISINSNGTLSGAGSGAVTPAGINAVNVDLSNAPAGILNSSVTLGTLGAGGFAYLSQITSANVSTYIAGAAIGTAQVGVLTAGNIGANTIDASKIAANTITAGQIASNTVTAGNIDSRNLTIKDASGNIIFGSGATVNAASYIVAPSGWLNSNISIGSNGILSGAGGGTVTATGINAVATDLSNAPAGILNSNVSLGTLGAGAFAYINAITTANVSTYINSAAIGTAQIGVLAAGNIGANTIDASKIAANTITAGQIAASTITATQIATNTITADRMSVSTLSAITANLGTITAGSISGSSLSVGSSPAVSGTTMTGAGAKINTDGTFVLGNSSTNIAYNGSAMYLNGNVVATGNINTNAVTLTSSAFTSASYLNTAGSTWQDAQTLSITTSGSQVYIASSGSPVSGTFIDGDNTGSFNPQFRLVRDTTVLMQGGLNPSMSYSETPSAGTYTYRIQVFSQAPAGSITAYAGLSNRSLFAIETKR